MPRMGVMKPIQIFKPGKHIAASGDAHNFSESDVAATIAAYDPALHEAPIVVGHPRHDLPAYGWVKALSFADGALDAEPQQVDPAFAELVDAGRFKKISASFYAPDSPSNPVPGVYYLRHVGFLGAQPPAVKGLRSPEFNEADEKVISFDFSEQSYGWSALAGMFRSLREYVIGKDGADKADQLIPNWQIDQLQRAAEEVSDADTPGQTTAPSFSDPITHPPTGEPMSLTKEQIEAMQAENTQLKASKDDFAKREAALAKHEQTQREQANASFCEKLVTAGKLHPAQKDNAASVLNGLAAATGAGSESRIDFSEDGKACQLPMVDAVKALLSAQPKIVEFGELGRDRTGGKDLDDPSVIASKATEFQEAEQRAGRTISIAEAVTRVTARI